MLSDYWLVLRDPSRTKKVATDQSKGQLSRRSTGAMMAVFMRRRDFLTGFGAASTTAVLGTTWEPGSVVHILHTVNDKISLHSALKNPPRFHVGPRRFEGIQRDTRGFSWCFDASGLEADRPYAVQLTDASGRGLCAPWNLRTFPDPSTTLKHFRLLVYTCAGGHDELLDQRTGKPRTLSLDRRRRLLRRALSFRPDAVLANGDHVYWDLLAPISRRLAASPAAERKFGKFDRTAPVFGSPNESILEHAAAPQIASLYGTMMREVPVFFVSDDHDYFENDDADDTLVTFPPDHFMLALARATRRLYYPEFLPDAARPLGLAGASAPDCPPHVAEAYGTLRYGKLAEILMYDCRRAMTLHGPSAVFVSREAEGWLKARMQDPEIAHVVNVPSIPPGWTAGKWGEWYPDVLDENGNLSLARLKPYWQPGWASQHDRLLAASAAMRERIPLFISGDMHAIGETRIHRSGQHDFSKNPVISLLSGPIGTDTDMWPSARRGTPPLKPRSMEADERQTALEENGFTILDFTSDSIVARMFKWNVRVADDLIDTLEPFRTVEMHRGQRS
jgi:hypothetical protein